MHWGQFALVGHGPNKLLHQLTVTKAEQSPAISSLPTPMLFTPAVLHLRIPPYKGNSDLPAWVSLMVLWYCPSSARGLFQGPRSQLLFVCTVWEKCPVFTASSPLHFMISILDALSLAAWVDAQTSLPSTNTPDPLGRYSANLSCPVCCRGHAAIVSMLPRAELASLSTCAGKHTFSRGVDRPLGIATDGPRQKPRCLGNFYGRNLGAE